jgi:uncharacterized protein (DUF2252 family)
MDAQERANRGRAGRQTAPRRSHGEWNAPADRPDPVAMLQQQATTRVPDLIPVRHQRMLVSPFTFYRGAAAIMAADLANTPTSGIVVQACGDAHLANFGGFSSPERRIVFDINDFDETLPAPWEWDVKRLATSFAIAAQDREFDDTLQRNLVAQVAAGYRIAMREFAAMRDLDVWYSHLDIENALARWSAELTKSEIKQVHRNVMKAESKNSLKAFAKLTETVDGRPRIINDPPLIVRFENLPDAVITEHDHPLQEFDRILREYAATLLPDRRQLLERYQLVDLARKVVGVGSVGTRCFIALLLGRDDDDPLFLQVKQAEASVLERYAGAAVQENHGQRVVEGQRLVQASSDIFLGWTRVTAVNGESRDYYIRQLWDGKVSLDLTTVEPAKLAAYAQMCGWTLARAHARSGDRIAIASYLGGSDVFDRAMVQFALSYAAQNVRDYDAATAAVRDGRLVA